MRALSMMTVAGLLLVATTGCATKIRTITSEMWEAEGKGLYLAYWEGTCVGGWCDAGEGKVMWCTVQGDNSLSCEDQQAVSQILSQK